MLPHRATFEFDRDVSASLDDSVVSVENLSANATPEVTTQADWWSSRFHVFPETSTTRKFLADGNHEAWLRGDRIHDGWVDWDWELGVRGEDDPDANYLGQHHRFDFWFLQGDLNRDRVVDMDDVDIVTANFGRTNAPWSEGNVNGDGRVDFQDIAWILPRFGRTLPAAPSWPGTVIAYPSDQYELTLTWMSPFLDHDGIRIWRSDNGFEFFQVADLEPSATTWVDTDLLDGAPYWYRVRTYTDAGGNSSTLPVAEATTLLPAPDELKAWRTDDRITLGWDLHSTSHDRLRLEWSVDGGLWQPLATLNAWTFDYTLPPVDDGATYAFRIFAEQLAADGVTVVQTLAPTMPAEVVYELDTPYNVRVVVSDGWGMDLHAKVTWQANSRAGTGFVVERHAAGGAWEIISQLSHDAREFIDLSPPDDVELSYRVSTRGPGGVTSLPATHTGSVRTSDAGVATFGWNSTPIYGQYVANFGWDPDEYPEYWRGWTGRKHNYYYGPNGPFGQGSLSFTIDTRGYSHVSMGTNVQISHGDSDYYVQRKVDVYVGNELVETYFSMRVPATEEWEPEFVGWIDRHVEFTMVPWSNSRLQVRYVPSGFFGDGTSETGGSWHVTGLGVFAQLQVVTLRRAWGSSERPDPATGKPKPIVYTLTRSIADNRELEVTALLTENSPYAATKGSDYRDPGRQAWTFQPGQHNLRVEVEVIDDEDLEPHEVVTLFLLDERDKGKYAIGDAPNLPGRFNRDRTARIVDVTIEDDDVRIILVGGRTQGSSSGTEGNLGIRQIGDFIKEIQENRDTSQYAGSWSRISDEEIKVVRSSFGILNTASPREVVELLRDGVNRVKNRALPVAMAGYSWGGGAIASAMEYLTSRRRSPAPRIDLRGTFYIDAIRLWTPFAETRRPVTSQYHFSVFQSMYDPRVNNAPNGGPANADYWRDLDHSSSHWYWEGRYDYRDL